MLLSFITLHKPFFCVFCSREGNYRFISDEIVGADFFSLFVIKLNHVTVSVFRFVRGVNKIRHFWILNPCNYHLALIHLSSTFIRGNSGSECNSWLWSSLKAELSFNSEILLSSLLSRLFSFCPHSHNSLSSQRRENVRHESRCFTSLLICFFSFCSEFQTENSRNEFF